MLPLQQFLDYIKKNALFTAHDKILLAVSGGKDSVLMLQLFKLSNYKFSIAHCNFNLRADESQRDEAFVRLLAASLDVPFYVAHFDTKSHAMQHGISIQMAARDLRYQWFEQVRKEKGYACVALAHHQNDSIETLLLNLTRGTGIHGLHGILPKRDYLVRPLLFLSRQEIDDLVEENNINFVSDSSNESIKYARNKIRLQIIPHLQEINPKLEETFSKNIERFVEIEEVLHQFVAQVKLSVSEEKNDELQISIPKLQQQRPKKLLLFELLRPYHFTSAVTDEILNSLEKQSGTSFYSRTHKAIIDRQKIIISPIAQKIEAPQIFVNSEDTLIKIGFDHISLTIKQATRFEARENKAYIDADLLIYPLIIRYRQDGDKFKPLGMTNFKKLSDFLIDRKTPLSQKDSIPLLVNGNGEIIWVVGLRQDDRYKVNATTKKVAIFEFLNHDGPKS